MARTRVRKLREEKKKKEEEQRKKEEEEKKKQVEGEPQGVKEDATQKEANSSEASALKLYKQRLTLLDLTGFHASD